MEAGDPPRVVPLLHSEGPRLIFVESPIWRVVEVAQVAERAPHPPSVFAFLLGWNRLEDIPDEIREILARSR